MLILLVIKISPFGRNDNKMNCDTVSKGVGGIFHLLCKIPLNLPLQKGDLIRGSRFPVCEGQVSCARGATMRHDDYYGAHYVYSGKEHS